MCFNFKYNNVTFANHACHAKISICKMFFGSGVYVIYYCDLINSSLFGSKYDFCIVVKILTINPFGGLWDLRFSTKKNRERIMSYVTYESLFSDSNFISSLLIKFFIIVYIWSYCTNFSFVSYFNLSGGFESTE